MTDSGRPPERSSLGMRQLVGAMVILLVLIGIPLALTRACSFDPGRPASDPATAPSVDVSVELREAASSATFPVRQPQVPRSWHANSSSSSKIGSGAGSNEVIRVGWLTPGGRYVQLSQSGGSVPDVLAADTGSEQTRTGSVEVDGVSWASYPSRRDEIAWVAELEGAVVLITGNGTEKEFRQLAGAVVASKPIER